MSKSKDENLRLSCIRSVIDSSPPGLKLTPETLVKNAEIIYNWIKADAHR